MPEPLPVVIVHKCMADGQVGGVSFDFSRAPELRDHVREEFNRALAGNTVGLGEPTFEMKPDTHELVVTLGHPTSNMQVLDTLLEVVASFVGYQMVLEARPTEERPSATGGARTASWKNKP